MMFFLYNHLLCARIYLFNRDDMYSSSRYTTYEYDDDSAPHSSRDYYESSDYPGKLLYLYTCLIILNIILNRKNILHNKFFTILF